SIIEKVLLVVNPQLIGEKDENFFGLITQKDADRDEYFFYFIIYLSYFDTISLYHTMYYLNSAGEITRNENIQNFLPEDLAKVFLNYEYHNKVNAFALFVACLPICAHLLGDDVYLNHMGNRLNPLSLNVLIDGATGTLKSTVIRQAIEPFERTSVLVPRLQMNVQKLTTNKTHSSRVEKKKEKGLLTNNIVSKSTIIDNTTPIGLLTSFNASNNLLIATTEADTQLSRFGLFDTKGNEKYAESSDTLIKAFDGEISNFSRMTGAGGSIFVEHGVLSFLGGSTLEKFYHLIRLILEYRAGTGLYTRFLYFVMPERKSIRVDAYNEFQIDRRLPTLSFLYLIISQLDNVEFRFRKTKNSRLDISNGIDYDNGEFDENSSLNYYVNHISDIHDDAFEKKYPQHERDIIVKMMEHTPRLCCVIQSLLIALNLALSFEKNDVDVAFYYNENEPIDVEWISRIRNQLNSMYFVKTPISDRNKYHVIYVERDACEIGMKIVNFLLHQALTLFNINVKHSEALTTQTSLSRISLSSNNDTSISDKLIVNNFADCILMTFKYNYIMKEWLRKGYPVGGSIIGPSPVPSNMIKNNLIFEKQLDELVQAGLLNCSNKMIEAGKKQSNHSRNFFKCYFRCLPGLSNEEKKDFELKLKIFHINTTLEDYIRFHQECSLNDLPKQYVIGKEQIRWYQNKPQYYSEFKHYFSNEEFLNNNCNEQDDLNNSMETNNYNNDSHNNNNNDDDDDDDDDSHSNSLKTTITKTNFNIDDYYSIVSYAESIKHIQILNSSSSSITTSSTTINNLNKSSTTCGFVFEMDKQKSKLRQILDSLCFIVGFDVFNEIITNINNLNQLDENKNKYLLHLNPEYMDICLQEKFRFDSFQNDIGIFSSTTSVNGCADLSHSSDDYSLKDDNIINLNQTIPSYNNNNNNIQLNTIYTIMKDNDNNLLNSIQEPVNIEQETRINDDLMISNIRIYYCHVIGQETNNNENDKSNHTIDSSQSNNHDIDQTIKQTAKLILLKGGVLFMKSYITIRNINKSATIRNAALKFLLDEKLIEYGNFLINQTKRTSTVYQAYLKLLPPQDNTNHSTSYVKRMKFLLSLSKLDLSEDDYKLSFKYIDQLSNHIETSIKCTKGMILSALGQQRLEEYNNLIWYDKTRWHIRMDDEFENDEMCDTTNDTLT
ncbi:unnamed protein product, partial [Rotaria sp. Silwood2]